MEDKEDIKSTVAKILRERKEMFRKQSDLMNRALGFCIKHIELDGYSIEVDYEPPVDEVSELDKYFVKKLDECSKKYGRVCYNSNICISPEKANFTINLPYEYPYSTGVKFLSDEYEREIWQPFLKDLTPKFDLNPIISLDEYVPEEKGKYRMHIKPYNQSNVNKRVRDLKAFLSIYQETSIKVNTLYEEQRRVYGEKLSEIIKQANVKKVEE